MVESRLLAVFAVLFVAGTALLLAELRWFRRPSLANRLLPHAANGRVQGKASGWPGLRTAVLPLAENLGHSISQLFGIKGDLDSRLRRARDSRSTSDVRLQELLISFAGLCIGAFLVVTVRPPLVVALLFLSGPPLLAFLLLEQRISSAAQVSANKLFAELPVVSEQLAMLLSAGYSLGAAVNRLADRGDGLASTGLKQVRDRNRQGIPIESALIEWAETTGVPELERLVTVIRTGSTSGDLSRLVSDEAKSLRRESQRRLSEVIEKRAQQVWVPVTVATLVPGVIFLCIPFMQALSLFSGT